MASASASQSKILHLPGTTLEGGGQLLRLSVGLSALTSTPVRISNIRGNRTGGGGLKGQHLASITWLADACGARAKGMQKKCKELLFVPDGATWTEQHDDVPARLTPREVKLERTIDIGSPGAVTLVFQAILPYLLFSPASEPVSVTILGGTNVSNSPSIDYVIHVLAPMLSSIGLGDCVHIRLNSRGWSTGRNEMGSVTFVVKPLQRGSLLPAFDLSVRGDIVKLEAFILGPKGPHDTFAAAVREAVVKERGLGIRLAKDDFVVTTEESGNSKRLYLLLVATSDKGYRLARDWLWGANMDFRSMRSGKGKPKGGRSARGSKTDDDDLTTTIATAVECVVNALAQELAHGGCVDEHTRDQLVVFQTLAVGNSTVYGGHMNGSLLEPSLHAKTAQWVASEMLGVTFTESGSCTGIGFEPGGNAATEAPGSDVSLAESLGKIRI